MNTELLKAPGDLFLGSDTATAHAQGSRHFSNAGKAIRFAMEQAAPVSLRGAKLHVGAMTLGPKQIRQMHARMAALGQAKEPGRKA